MALPPLSPVQPCRLFRDLREKQSLPVVFMAIVAAIVWLPRMNDAFFVDEAATFWFIEAGVVEGIRRALSITGQSWFYSAVLASWSSVFGTSEVAMRLPSTLAALAACALAIRIGRDRNAGAPVLASILLALMPLMTFAATIARPYAFGLFFSTLATSCLLSWTRRNRIIGLYGSVVATLCAVYCHYTFIAILIPLLFVLIEKKTYKHDWGSLLKASILFLAGLIPLMLALTHISRHDISAVAIIDRLPSGETLCLHFFSPTIALAVGLIFSVRVTVLRRRSMTEAESSPDRSHFLPISWPELRLGLALYVAPKLLTLCAALAIDPTLLVPRYSILSILGEAYTASVLLATVRSQFWMMCLGCTAVVSMLLPHFMSVPPDTAWRPIIDRSHEISARDSCTFFALVGFAESRRVELLTKEPTHSFILSPLSYYKLEPAVLLPASIDSREEQDYMSKMVYPKIPTAQCNLVLDWMIVDSSPSTLSGSEALSRELSARGCARSPSLSAGLVTLTHWQCEEFQG